MDVGKKKEFFVNRIMERLEGVYTAQSHVAVCVQRALLKKLSYEDLSNLLVMLVTVTKARSNESRGK